MNDVMTQRPLRVSTDSTAGPYLRLLVSQLDEVERRLTRAGVRYWVDEDAISFDGGPEFTVINFGHAGDASAVQALLDGAQ